MSRLKFCPVCDTDISDSYESAEPDVGIMTGGWYCDECGVVIAEDEQDDDTEERHRRDD